MASEAAGRFILATDESPEEAQVIAQSLANEITSDKLKMVQIVQSLGEYLIDEDTATRSKALLCISSVLDKLPRSKLSQQHVAVIYKFFKDRLDDEECLAQVSDGLMAVSKMDGFRDADVKDLFNSIVTHFDLQKQPQKRRFAVYRLINTLLKHHKDAILKFSDEFIPEYFKLCAGEKDPRNLMTSFETDFIIITELDISKFYTLTFDGIFCYFPITFKAPQDDPYHISADDLKMKLRSCIAGNPGFAELAFPALLEKAVSTSPSVKEDTLVTLKDCITNYHYSSVVKYWAQIWDAVKYEALYTGEDNRPEAALDVLKALTSKLSEGPPPDAEDSHHNHKDVPTSEFKAFIAAIISEAKEKIDDNNKLATPASKIVAKCSEASPLAFQAISDDFVTYLLSSFETTSAVARYRLILEAAILMLRSSAELYGLHTDPTVGSIYRQNYLSKFKDKLFNDFTQSLMGSSSEEISLKVLAIEGLTVMVELTGLLENNEVGLIVQYLDDILLTVTNETLCKASLKSLEALARVDSTFVLDICFPAFLAHLPDSDLAKSKQVTATTGAKESKSYKWILYYMTEISIEREIFVVLIVRLLNKLDVVLAEGGSADYCQSIAYALLKTLVKKTKRGDSEIPNYLEALAVPLVNRCLEEFLVKNEDRPRLCNEGFVGIVSRILTLCLQAHNPDKQEAFANQMVYIFIGSAPEADNVWVSNSVSNFGIVGYATETEKGILRLAREKNGDKSAISIVGFLTSSLACLPKSQPAPVSLSCISIVEFLQLLIDSTIPNRDLYTRMCLLRSLCLAINKWLNKGNACDQFLTKVVDPLKKTILENESSSSSDATIEALSKLEVVCWIAKAFLLRSEDCGYDLTSWIMERLSSRELGLAAAQGCGILISDDGIVCKAADINARLLHKQRFFTFVVPVLVEFFTAFRLRSKGEMADNHGHEDVESIKDLSLSSNYLIALSKVLQSIPNKVIIPELESFLPLLLQSLELDEPQVKAATIDTLATTMKESSELLSQHLPTIIPRLLDAITIVAPSSTTETKNKESSINTEPVRRSALHCLSILPDVIRRDQLQPYMQSIMHKLEQSLDDPRRSIRKAAVDCRQKYFAHQSASQPEITTQAT